MSGAQHRALFLPFLLVTRATPSHSCQTLTPCKCNGETQNQQLLNRSHHSQRDLEQEDTVVSFRFLPLGTAHNCYLALNVVKVQREDVHTQGRVRQCGLPSSAPLLKGSLKKRSLHTAQALVASARL